MRLRTLEQLEDDIRNPTKIIDSIRVEGKVILIQGRKRQGKSLFAGWICYDFFKAGWRIVHNGSLTFGELLDPVKLAELGYKNCVIFIDEAHEWLDSRRGMTLQSVMSTGYLTQVGKLNNWLICATHDIHDLDWRLRRAADMVITIQKRDPPDQGAKTLDIVNSDINGVYSDMNLNFNYVAYNMDRFYPTIDTSATFAYEAARITPAMMKEKERYAEQDAVYNAVAVFVMNNRDRVTSSEVSRWIHENMNLTLSMQTVGKYIVEMPGIKKRIIQGVRFYDLTNIEVEESNDAA